MSLKIYQKKRDFKNTSEPVPKKAKTGSILHFCVQKHFASHLHYDFRLEYKGVLLSWAIPKGPSLNPNDKRLAIRVEDHPLEYRHFEGIIPKGNYGAGKVEIWDEGIYSVPQLSTRQQIEKSISAGIEKGHISFTLHGKKLQGEFDLIKMQNSDKNWLFVKRRDEFAAESDIEIAEQKKETPKKKAHKAVKMPKDIKPMLATLIDAPFDHPEWIFEIKFDGYRALSYVHQSVVELISRNNNSFNQMFPSIVNELKKLKIDAILDGEIVILDKHGKSQFQLMQNYQKKRQGALYYYVFDILFLDGKDLREEPLVSRKKILKNILEKAKLNSICYSEHIEAQGIKVFKEIQKKELEGIIGKKADSRYVSARSKQWVKIKTHLRQEAVIVGFTQPQGARKYFGALLLGVYEQGKLKFIGHAGTGFNTKLLEDIFKQMGPLVQKKSPFENEPKTNPSVTWLKPKLVCEISFQEWTTDGLVRQAVFQGMRVDKNAKSITREKQKPMEEIEMPLALPKKNAQVPFSNPEKIYFPKEKYTKGDLLSYYQEVSAYLLPYLKNHPVMLHRFPDGIEGENFYQKDSSQLKIPDWMETITIEHERKPLRYILIQNLKALEYVINLGTIALHPYMASIKKLDSPEYLVIDLDPEDIDFEHVVHTAREVHSLLDELGVSNYCKTSGGRGLHIYVPLHAKYDFEQSKHFGELIAAVVNQRLPKITSLMRSPKSRQKKVYLDVYQNNSYQSVIAPYSVRGKEGAPVSTPLSWDEVKKGLDPKKFTIKSVPQRLKQIGDIFKPVIGKGNNLKKALKILENKIL